MEISLGLITYRNQDNLNRLLKSIIKLKLNKVRIQEIIIVGVYDEKTYIQELVFNLPFKVKLIFEKQRKGKYYAVNHFLKNAKSKILVLCSGDITLHKNSLENLCTPLYNKKIGIVASRPISGKSKNKYIDFTCNLIWDAHHFVSCIEPKFGELIAFRNLNFQLHSTSVDEEMIAKNILLNGLNKYYDGKAIIFNKPSKNIKDHISRRRRIFCGHMNLKAKYHYNVPSNNNLLLISYLQQKISIKDSLFISIAVILELYSRTFGFLDFLFGKEQIIWKVEKSIL